MLSFNPQTNRVYAINGVEHAFGAFGIDGISGAKATVWTAQQPATNNFRASPVAVCAVLPPCHQQAAFVETGYYKGVGAPAQNVLQQYATWLKVDGRLGKKYELGNLNNNTWYTFLVVWNAAKGKWAIKRDGTNVYTIPDLPVFGSASMAACGAEAGADFTTIAVQCNNMAFRSNGQWTLINYDFEQTTPGYCVDKPLEFGALGWGPC